MLTTSIALILASAAFLVHEFMSLRQTAVHDLTTLADITGVNCQAAIKFDDQSAAKETLSFLHEKKYIVAAKIYNSQGKLFAEFDRKKGGLNVLPKNTRSEGNFFTKGNLVVIRKIKMDGEFLGMVGIQSDLQEMRDRIKGYFTIVIIVMFAACLVALFVSSQMQRLISEPILGLAKTAGQISDQKDYSVRVKKQGEDELGALYDAFNDMLAQIQERDAALQEAHDELEARVARRTEQLQREVTERKRAERIAQRENAKLSTMISGMEEGVIFADAKNTIVEVNDHFCRFVGLKRSDVLGKHIQDIESEEARNLLCEMMEHFNDRNRLLCSVRCLMMKL